MSNSGIYEIRNRINGKRYVGSSKELDVRKQTHFNYLREGKHINKHLQFAVNKYGIENFEFNVLEYCEEDYLITLEQWYFDNENCCYNINMNAGGGCGPRHDVRLFDSQDIYEIVEMTLAGFTQKEIAEYYDCGQMTINNIVKRNIYKDVQIPKPLLNKLNRYLFDKKHGRKFTCEQVEEIKRLWGLGIKQKEIAEEYNVSRSIISEMCSNKSYQHCN